MPTNAINHASKNKSQYFEELKDFLRIPSISIREDHFPDVEKAADWLITKLEKLAFPIVKLFKTNYHPLVYAEDLSAGAEKPTILFYGHYDVQPPEPLEDWLSDPFNPTIRGESLFARGVSDNKGDISTFLSAIDAIKSQGSLPINIKVLIEGEEEVGSESLKSFIPENKELLQADFCLNLDSGMADYNNPSITYGLRGGRRFDLTIFGPKKALHSGMFGGVIENPIHVLSNLITSIHDKEGRITIPGFYNNIRPFSNQEKELSLSNPKDDAFFLKESGAPALWGDPEYSAYERSVLHPTCDVLMIQGGERKNAITATASAFISFRLVPDQDGEEVEKIFRKFIEDQLPKTVRMELNLISSSSPSLLDIDTPYIAIMKNVLKETWDTEPIIERSGGGIPIVSMLKEHLNIGSVLTGITLPDDNLHGPNEKIDIPTWEKGIETVIRFITMLGEN